MSGQNFSIPFKTLCSSLKSDAYKFIIELQNVDAASLDLQRINDCIRECVDDRLSFAQEFLDFAVSLQVSPGAFPNAFAARTAFSRSYYSLHHAIRALLLFVNRRDEPDHRPAIDAISKVIDSEKWLSAKYGNKAKVRRDMILMLDRRHDADYHMYGTAIPSVPPLDFSAAAIEATAFAQRFLSDVGTFISHKEAGIL